MNQPRRLGTLLLIALCVLPPLTAFYMTCAHWVPVPYWDEWDTPAQQLAVYYRGTLGLADLFSQHNESRNFFPRLFYLAIYLPAGWDMRIGMAFTLALVGAGSVGLYRILRRTNPASGAVLLVFAVMNFLLFSPRQYQNFLHAIMIEEFAPACALIFALLINLSDRSLKAKTLGNAALALIATYTFANGMLLWLLAFPLETTRAHHARARITWRITYVLVAAASVAGYFISYRHPPLSPPFVSPFAQLPAFLDFYLVWLGSLFSVGAPALCGAVVLLLFLGLAAAAIAQIRRTGGWRIHYPWLVLGCYTLISGCVVAVGRLGFDYSMAGDVRYTAFTAFLYIAIVGLGFSVSAQVTSRPLVTRIAIPAALVALMVLGTLWAITFNKERHLLRALTAARQHCLLVLRWSEAIPRNPEIALLSPYPIEDMLSTIRTLAANDALRPRLVSPRLLHAITDRSNADAAASAGNLDAATFESANQLTFQGWARVPDQDRPADCVVLGFETSDRIWEPFCVVGTGGTRPDVARHFGIDSLRLAGFSGRVNVTNLPPGELTLRARAVDFQDERAFPVANAVSLPRPR